MHARIPNWGAVLGAGIAVTSFLRQRRGDRDIESVAPQAVVEEIEAAVVLQSLEQPADFFPPDPGEKMGIPFPQAPVLGEEKEKKRRRCSDAGYVIFSSSGHCHATQLPWLSAWPLAVPERWLQYVNKAEADSELTALRRSVARGAPSGDETWQQQTAAAWGLESALRRPGRPRKEKAPVQT